MPKPCQMNYFAAAQDSELVQIRDDFPPMLEISRLSWLPLCCSWLDQGDNSLNFSSEWWNNNIPPKKWHMLFNRSMQEHCVNVKFTRWPASGFKTIQCHLFHERSRQRDGGGGGGGSRSPYTGYWISRHISTTFCFSLQNVYCTSNHHGIILGHFHCSGSLLGWHHPPPHPHPPHYERFRLVKHTEPFQTRTTLCWHEPFKCKHGSWTSFCEYMPKCQTKAALV